MRRIIYFNIILTLLVIRTPNRSLDEKRNPRLRVLLTASGKDVREYA